MNPTFTPVRMLENLPTVDFDALVAVHQRNCGAAVEACRVATEGFKAVAQRQDEILRANVAELQSRIGRHESPEQYLELAAAVARESFDQVREVAELAAKANKDLLDVMTRRSSASNTEFEAAVKVFKA